MVAEAVFLDLSSSDEDEEDHNQNPNGWADSTGLSYLSKVCVLQAEEEDVVIIDKPSSNDKSKRDKPRVIRTVMDDDECCMLDTDPSAIETTDFTPPLDSDELVMTGEKGPVACRDFPHARYLCVHFPFKTTLHASFCMQCHCYVCDSLAPCPLWGDGNSAGDHCHASEESPWKALRKLAKFGPVSSSRATPVPAATVATQSGITVSNINGITTPMSNFVPPSILQARATSLSPVSESSVVSPSPVGLGISLPVRGNTTATTGPLVIRLSAKGRGKPSQRPYLGVRSPKPPHRSSPGSVFSRNNRSLPVPRSRPVPSERIPDPVLPIPAQITQPLQQSQFYSSPGSERTGSGTAPFPSQQVPAFNTVPGTAGGSPVMTPLVNFPETLGSSNAAPYYPFQAPPLPNSPPPYIPPPPPPAFTSGAYNIPSPVSAVYDRFPMQQLPAGDASAAGFVSHIPDSTYVSPSDQQVHNMAPHYEDYAFALPRPDYGLDYSAQDYKSPVVEAACYATPSYNSTHGDNRDILEEPTEGWAAEAASLFDSFTPGVGNPDHANQQAATSLEKVLEQMAGDDYLWEQFPSW